MSLSPTVPRRDRRTWVSYAQMGAYGFFVYALGASQILLREEQQTSRTIAKPTLFAQQIGTPQR